MAPWRACVLALTLIGGLSAGPVGAEDFAAECDRLAGDLAVRLEDLDGEAARAACDQAVRDNPGVSRFLHQYARAIERLGDGPTAMRLYQWAAGDGYPPAQYAFGRMLASGAVAEPDPAAAEAWFRLAAEQGYVPADAPAGAVAPSPVAAQAAAINGGPDALLVWTAAEIAPEGYPGALRGAEGTLSAAAGSAADKALLLRALIQAADPAAELRFAGCDLPDAVVDELAAAVQAAQPPRIEPLIEVAGRFAPEIQDPAIRPIVDGLAAAWQDAVGTVVRHAGTIAGAFAAEGVGYATPSIGDAELRQALGHHVWLQIRQGEAWVDLDPTLPQAAPGRSRCTAAWTGGDLPASAMHRLDVRLVAEERAHGVVRTRPLLDHAFVTADLPDANLTLLFGEPVGHGEAVPERPPPPEGFLAYTPMLRWGGTEAAGEAIELPRPASAADVPGGLSDALNALGGALDAMGGLSGAAPPAAVSPPETEVTALWLHLTLAGPAGTETVDTPLFDRIGFAARAEGRVADAPVLPLAEVDGEYQALAAIWNVAVWTGRWRGEDEPDLPPGDDLDTLVAGLAELHGAYDILRRALFAAAQGDRAERFVAVRPGLSLLGWIPSATPGGADLVMDVLTDPARRLAGSPDNGPDDGSAGIAWAVSSVVAERLVVGMDRLFLSLLGGTDVPPFAPVDVAAVFDGARDQGIDLAWLDEPLAAAAAPVAGSDEAVARVQARLSAGQELLVPRRAVPVGSGKALGWWLLDPDTGALRDEFETGRHQSGEYAVTTQPSREAAPVYRRSVGQRVLCTINRAVGVLSLVVGIASGSPEAAKGAWYAAKVEAKVARAAERTRRAGKAANEASGACGGPPR